MANTRHRCKHVGRAVLVEYGTASTTHVRNEVGQFIHDSKFGDYTGQIEVVCGVCNLRRIYTPRERRPRWVQKLIDEATK